MRPILNYFGGKWILAPWIIEHFPAHEIYVEPFGGAASVLLRKQESRVEVYNDLDSEVYNLFKVLRQNPKELIEALNLTPYSFEEYEKSYDPPKGLSDVEKARRTIVKSFMGIGDSISDQKKSGFRCSKTSNVNPAQSFRSYADEIHLITKRLKSVIIENNDFVKIIERYDTSTTLFYFDPPYTLNQRSGKHNYRHDFEDKDQLRFLSSVLSLKGMAIISGYDNQIYREHLNGWEVKNIDLYGNQVKKVETLWLSPSAVKAQRQMTLFGDKDERE